MPATQLKTLSDAEWTLISEGAETVAIQIRQGTARIAVSDDVPASLEDSFILSESGPRQLTMGGMSEAKVYARSTPIPAYGSTKIVVLSI